MVVLKLFCIVFERNFMEKHSISIDAKLYSEISEYCKINGLKVANFCNELLSNAFSVEKYGDIPFGVFKNEPQIEEKEEEMSVEVKEAPAEEKVEEKEPEVKVIAKSQARPNRVAPKPRKRILN